MKPYSLDLRERVAAAYEQGKGTIKQVAQMFSVGETFVKKMLRQKRETNNLSPQPQRAGAKRRLQAKDLRWLEKTIAREPDATITELAEQLSEEKQATVSRATICRELKELRLARKKRVSRDRNATIENELGFGAR